MQLSRSRSRHTGPSCPHRPGTCPPDRCAGYVAHLHRLLQDSHHRQPGVRRNLDIATLHSHHLDVVGGHLSVSAPVDAPQAITAPARLSPGTVTMTLPVSRDTLAGVGLFASGEAHHRRIEGEVRHKANGSQVRRTILLFRADQRQWIGGCQNSSSIIFSSFIKFRPF